MYKQLFRMKRYISSAILVLMILLVSCSEKKPSDNEQQTIVSNKSESGLSLEVKFMKGKSHNHPTFSIWVEDLEGRYLETLLVTQYIGSGIYGHGALGVGKWDSKPGPAKRPSALPYWLHKRGVKADGETYLPTPSKPIPDAITSATPKGDFLLKTVVKNNPDKKFKLLFEINQPWDWNEFWNNSLYPDDFDYSVSCQPALVYAVIVDPNEPGKELFLNPIGHSHHSGKNGELFTDLTTFSTAKDIIHKVSVSVKK
jgi:hypothetical protein